MLSGTHRSRSFSPNPQLFPSTKTEARGPGVTAARGPTTISPNRRCHARRQHLAAASPEPGPDPSSRRRAQKWEEAPVGGPGALLGKGRDRGMLAARASPGAAARRRRRGPLAAEEGGVGRRGAEGGSRADRSGRGYSLSQDSRLSPSASAILQPPGPAQRPQTSREPVRDGSGRGLHGGLRRESAAEGGVRLRRKMRRRMFPFDSCLWTSE